KMINVGPTQNNAIKTTTAKNILILLKFLMPLSIPDQADQVNNTVAITIITTCVPKLEGILNKKFNPSLICNAPKPNVAATPVTVAIIASTSIAPPIGPRIIFSPKMGLNVALTNPGYPLGKLKYANTSPTIPYTAHACIPQW